MGVSGVAATGRESRYDVLGVGLRVICDDSRVHSLARDCLMPLGASASEVPLSLQISVLGDLMVDPVPAPEFRLSGRRFDIRTSHGAGTADQDTGRAVASVYLGAESASDVQIAFIETLAVFLAYARRPIALHGALLVAGGRGVIVTGQEGAGKSTLAYACLLAGMKLVADDVVYFTAAEPPLVGWGQPASLYLVPNAKQLFPELVTAEQVRRLNGELKLRVPIAPCFPTSALSGHRIDSVVTLSRTSGRTPALSPAAGGEVIDALTGFRGDLPLNHSAMHTAARHLVELPCARLEVGDSPHEAASCLYAWMTGRAHL